MNDVLNSILDEGGPVLWGLLGLAFVLYASMAATWSGLRRVRRRVEAGAWHVARNPPGDPRRAAADLGRRRIEREFAAFELDELAWVERRLPLLGVMTGAAPLLGLLGTVAGMLITFSGLAGAGHGASVDTISAGISKALVTTQAGLAVAVPAAFLLALLRRSTERTQYELQRQLHAELAVAAGAVVPGNRLTEDSPR